MSQEVEIPEDVKVKTEEPAEILVVRVKIKKKLASLDPALTPRPQPAVISGKEVGSISKVPPPEPVKDHRPISDSERKRLSREKETPEQRRERLRRDLERRKALTAKETPEQRRVRLNKRNISGKLKRGTKLSEKELELVREWKWDDNSQSKFKGEWSYRGQTDQELEEEVKNILIEKRDKLKHQVTWEEDPDGKLLMSRVEMQRVKTNYQRLIRTREKGKGNRTEEKLARDKEVKKFRELVRRAHMSEEDKQRLKLKNYLNRHARMASMPKDERGEWLQSRSERAKERMRNWTEEQKQRHKENNRKAIRRYLQKNKGKYNEYHKEYYKTPEQRQKRLEYNKEKFKNETPEQRQKRLLGYRISQAKRLLKRKLEKNGVAPQEIQKGVDQLVLKMKSEPLPPPETVSQYKPQPHRKKTQRRQKENIEGSKLEVQTIDKAASSTSSGAVLKDFGTFVETNDSPYCSPMASPMPPQSCSELCSAVADYELREQEQDLQDKLISSRNVIEQTEEVQIEVTDPQPHPTSLLSSPPVECEMTETPVETKLSQPEPLTSTSLAPSSVKCPHCPSYFPQLTKLHPHIRSSHPEKCWKCPKCFAVVLSPPELAEHFKSHQTSSQAKAPVKQEHCKETSRDSNPSKGPGRRKTAPGPVKTLPFTCMKCPMRPRSSKPTRFETHEKLTQHVRVAHPMSFFPCSQCKLLKYNSSSLQIHLKICRKKLKS